MMVQKIAVIALVAIISVPILLGYAMNLNEVTVSDYDTTGDSVNVSQLLQVGTRYNYVGADLNSINTNFKQIYDVRNYLCNSRDYTVFAVKCINSLGIHRTSMVNTFLDLIFALAKL